MEDAWDWVQEELKKIQEEMPVDSEMMQVVDAISVADFWKRRHDEELMLWDRKLEIKEDEKKALESKAQMHETAIKELEWKLKELERRWDQEKLLLEDRIKSKEVQAEIEKRKFEWESRLKALEDENKNLKVHMSRVEGLAISPELKNSLSSDTVVSGRVEYSHAEKDFKHREDVLKQNEDEIRRQLEKLEAEKKQVAETLSVKEKELESANQMFEKLDKESKNVSAEMSIRLTSLKEREREHFVILEDLARGFAHRVRNYLGIMSGTAQLCISNYKLDEELEEQLKIVDQNVQDMLKSIEDFLALSRIPDMHFEQINFTQVLDNALQFLEGKFKEQNIAVNKKYDQSLPMFKGDPKLFGEAITNLMQNALESMPQGGELTVTTFYEKSKQEICVKIADNGVGISETHIRKVFQPYFSSKKNHKGLGLTMAKRVVDLHRGTLHVESAKGKGTTVTINLFMDLSM